MGISLYDGVGPQATGASDLGEIKHMNAVSGMDEVAYEHPVEDPAELTANLDPDGRLDSLEILDQNGARTKLNFF